MSYSQGFDELIHSLILKHPALSVPEIAVHLWGEGNQDAKGKRLYRQVNPYDDTASLKVVDPERLNDVLDTDRIIEHQARRRGLVTYRLPDVSVPEDVDGQGVMKALVRTVKEFGEFAAEAAANGSQIDKEGYEAIEAIVSLMALARRRKQL